MDVQMAESCWSDDDVLQQSSGLFLSQHSLSQDYRKFWASNT